VAVVAVRQMRVLTHSNVDSVRFLQMAP
jgi:hypothetical protein